MMNSKFGKILLGSLIAVGVLICFVMQPFPRPFDSQLWRNCQPRGREVRVSMVDDLIAKYKLVGMTRKQIFDLLGQPEGAAHGDNATWDMGVTTGHDDNFLYVFFKDDKVERFEITRR